MIPSITILSAFTEFPNQWPEVEGDVKQPDHCYGELLFTVDVVKGLDTRPAIRCISILDRNIAIFIYLACASLLPSDFPEVQHGSGCGRDASVNLILCQISSSNGLLHISCNWLRSFLIPTPVMHGKNDNCQYCLLIPERGKLQNDLLLVNACCLTHHNKMVQHTS